MALEASVTYSNGIVGSSSRADREGSSAVVAYSHSIVTPFDPSTGSVGGQGEQSPVTITKPLDTASAQLLQAWRQGTKLDALSVRFYRVTPAGSEEAYITVTLFGVVVAEVRQEMLNTNYPENETSVPREHVSFLYEKLNWSHVDGYEYEFDWASAA